MGGLLVLCCRHEHRFAMLYDDCRVRILWLCTGVAAEETMSSLQGIDGGMGTNTCKGKAWLCVDREIKN